MLNSRNKVIILTVLFVAIFVSAFFVLGNKPVANNAGDSQNLPAKINNEEIVLYYGETCPHCKIVEAYIANNNFTLKSKIVNKEVFNDKANANELEERARTCSIPNNEIGVPLLWYKNRCYVGDQSIINLFKTTDVQ